MFGRPRRKSTPLHDRRLFHARLRFEPLEDRRLLAMGDLLKTFADPNTASELGSGFGFTVAVDGQYTVVGAPYAKMLGFWSLGRAYVFNTSTGALVATLDNPTPANYDYFGDSVAISGSTVVVGVGGDDAGATNAGSAYVFDAATGNLLHTLNNPTAAADDFFGRSVAISGSTVVVGAYQDDTLATDAGSAYVFDAVTGNLLLAVNNPTPAADDWFGCSVAVSGSRAIVGAYGMDGSTLERGAAYLFDVNPAESTAVGFGGSRGSWIWNSPGVWTPLHGATPIWMVTGDWDGNGKQDIVANFGGSTGIWVYRDTGAWQWLHGISSNTAVMADLNADGRDELVLSTSAAGATGVWAYYPAKASWRCLSGWYASAFAVGDFDGNGKQDVATDFGPNGLWLFDNDATWQYKHNFNPAWMAAGNLDGNGKSDLIVSFNGANHIWTLRDTGALSYFCTLASSVGAAGDFNHDGRDELAINVTAAGSAGLWEYTPATNAWCYLSNWRAENLAIADVDGNGKMDMAVDFGSSGLWLWKNDAAWQCMHGFDAAVLAGAKQPAQAPQAAMSASARGELLLAMLDQLTTDALNAKRRVKL